MEVTNLFIYKIMFAIQILSGLYLFSCKQTLKSKPGIRIPIAVICSLLVAIFFPIIDDFSYTWYGISIMFFLIFIVSALFLKFVFDMSWLQLFFLSVITYTSQHMLHQVYSIFCIALGFDKALGGSYNDNSFLAAGNIIAALRFLIIAVVYSIGYVLIYNFMVSKIVKKNRKIGNVTIIFISALILIVDIFLNSIVINNSEGANLITSIIICVYDFISCLVVLFLLYYILANKGLQEDLIISDILLQQSESKYEQSKENVDLINIKCHDLKHQIRKLGKDNAQISQEALNDIADTINIYDKTVNTNNDALDVIIMEKALLCQKDNINLKCYADCSKLSFISNVDLYSLFGNAIDNAIEAVKKIEDKSKRNINVIVKNVNDFVSITIENYYDHVILSPNGDPITTKEDDKYHGFGIKSIKYIVKKYDGDVNISFDNNIFTLSILFNVEK